LTPWQCVAAATQRRAWDGAAHEDHGIATDLVNRACLRERINKRRRQPLAFPVVSEGRLRTSPFMPFTTLVMIDTLLTSTGGYLDQSAG
jgi:hypothetical protein